MKYIYLPPDKKKEMLELSWPMADGVRRRISLVTLQSALKFKTHTSLANALRAAALARGGIIYDSDTNGRRLRPQIDVSKTDALIDFRIQGSSDCSSVVYDCKTRTAKLSAGPENRLYKSVSPVRLLALFRMAERLASSGPSLDPRA